MRLQLKAVPHHRLVESSDKPKGLPDHIFLPCPRTEQREPTLFSEPCHISGLIITYSLGTLSSGALFNKWNKADNALIFSPLTTASMATQSVDN